MLAITKKILEGYAQDDPKTAGYSIEIWNFLFEAEIERAKDPSLQQYNIIKTFEWKELATLFLTGLKETGFGEEDHTIEDDMD